MSDNQAPVQSHGCQNFTVPGRVTTGVPVQRTSILVVCPLHKGVSRHTSANCPRLTCSSLAATLLKRILPGGRPSCWAAACKLGSPTAGKRSSHSTELGTCFSICWERVLWKFSSSCKAFYFSVQSVAWYYWVSRLQSHHSAGSLLKHWQLFMLKNKLPAYVEFYGYITMFTKAW